MTTTSYAVETAISISADGVITSVDPAAKVTTTPSDSTIQTNNNGNGYLEAGGAHGNVIAISDTNANNPTIPTGPGNIAVGQENIIESNEGSSSAYGNQNRINGSDANAFGDGNYAVGGKAQTFGDNNTVNGKMSVAFGINNQIGGTFEDRPNDPTHRPVPAQTAENSVAFGNNNQVRATDSVAVGHDNTIDNTASQSNAVGRENTISSKNSLAVGSHNRVGAVNAPEGNSFAFGNGNMVMGQNTVAVGNDAMAMEENSVVLGHNSTDRSFTRETNGSITSGSTTLTYGNFYGNAQGVVSVGQRGMFDRQIINVAPGRVANDSTDAINGSQLYATNKTLANLADSTAKALSPSSTITPDGSLNANINVGGNTYNNVQDAINSLGPAQQAQEISNLNNRVDTVNNRVDTVNNRVTSLDHKMKKAVAGAYAVAALHPLDFNPDDKWSFAVGYGNYSDKNAMAIGTFYQPNEDMLLSFGTSMGNGENGYNAGLSFKIGRGQHVNTTRVAMAKEIIDLRKENQTLKDRLDKIEQRLNNPFGSLDPNKVAAFPDTPENHWVYQYVATLAGNGLITGYPDGTFKGDQAMTRYEWATVFYRALMNGAPVDDNMNKALKEFSPEIQDIAASRVRVDRISGKDNARNKVERAHVNNEDKKIKDIYGSTITAEQK